MIGHRTANAMARVLVQYLPDDRRVQSEVRASFGSAPCLGDIRTIRDKWHRGKVYAPVAPPTAEDGYWPSKEAQAAAIANRRFVIRLIEGKIEMLRRAAAAEDQRAVLTKPECIDSAWEREIELAKLEIAA